MKRIFNLLIIIALTVFISCNPGAEKKSEESEKAKTSVIKDCEDFIEHYEAWGDKYIEVIDMYMKNPTDEKNASKYMELMQEAMLWSTKWTALVDCADNDEYAKRFENVAKEIEAKLQELGL